LGHGECGSTSNFWIAGASGATAPFLQARSLQRWLNHLGLAKKSSGDRGFLNYGETSEGFFLDGVVGHVAMIGVAVDGKVQWLSWNGFQLTREALG
jgi:hypothetical protein